MTSAYDFSATDLAGADTDLSAYGGQVSVIVNVASKCGFTPQYEGLEKLYRDYADDGFVVLGFPCNQFGNQEPGDADEIAGFCTANYGVTFPMFQKIDVNGPGAHPLWTFLKKSRPGFAGSKNIKWNFTKFLVDRDGKPKRRFGPNETPQSMRRGIEKLLAA